MVEVIDHKPNFGSHWYRLFVHPGERVEIHKFEGGNVVNIRVFHQGDEAEYDSFNLIYTAPIEKITAKNAIFRVYKRRKMLKWSEFAWRNVDFDVEEARKMNSETMNHI